MNTPAPSNEITVYDRINMKRKSFVTVLAVIDQLIKDKAIDVRASGQPDVASCTPEPESKQAVVRFKCGGVINTFWAPLGGRSKSIKSVIDNIKWVGGVGAGSATSHIMEPDEAPQTVEPVAPSSERSRRVLSDEELMGGFDYHRLAQEAIK